jgi:hypothetical protein
MKVGRLVLRLAPLASLSIDALAQAAVQPPRIWDDDALADWATQVARLNVRPSHNSSDRRLEPTTAHR